MPNPAKQRIALRHLLLGRGWYQACQALEMAAEYHRGTRKDGVTPEVAHPIAAALWVWTLEKQLLYPEQTVIAALLHDIAEDYGVSFEEFELHFGSQVSVAVRALSKTWRGQVLDADQVTRAIARDPIASVVKPADRINNQDSMIGVFGVDKMLEYITETERHILPAIKIARRNFPQQEQAYQNAKLSLESQVRMVRGLLTSEPPTRLGSTSDRPAEQ